MNLAHEFYSEGATYDEQALEILRFLPTCAILLFLHYSLDPVP